MEIENSHRTIFNRGDVKDIDFLWRIVYSEFCDYKDYFDYHFYYKNNQTDNYFIYLFNYLFDNKLDNLNYKKDNDCN